MRILILSINYWPEVTGIGAFTTCRAEYLASAGHDVTVCTTFPYYPEWKVAENYRGKWFASERRNGVHILRTRVYLPNPVTSLRRVLHEASYLAGSLPRALAGGRPDVILAVSPPLGLGVTASLLGRFWRVPFVFDVEDLQPDAAADLGMLPGWALRILYGVEKHAYRHAALVSTITRGMRSRILQKGVPPQKVVLFEPRAEESLFQIAPEEGVAFRRKHGLEGKFLVTHSGNLGVKQGMDVILDAAARTREEADLQFLLVGDGADRERLERRAAQMSLTNVRFLPLLPAEEFRGLLAASDACLVTQRRSVSDIVFPSKTVTYLAAGCPVVASVNSGSEVAQTIRDSGAGLVAEPEDAEALGRALAELRQRNPAELRRSAREYARLRWSSERVLGFIASSLVSVIGSAPGALAKQELR
ncbi:MAG TPA: WcaI family glycosyltransferase [Terracidiphilus sp.]|nr:WcaI family glycosyltransferase [Terracidiphilus sp.]